MCISPSISRASSNNDALAVGRWISPWLSAVPAKIGALKDFVQDRLGLPWDEFNRVPVAGITNIARPSEMLEASAIGCIIKAILTFMAQLVLGTEKTGRIM
jgi:hypothetical protein